MTQDYVCICLTLKTNTEKEIELQNSQRICLLVYCYDKKNVLLKKRKSMHCCMVIVKKSIKRKTSQLTRGRKSWKHLNLLKMVNNIEIPYWNKKALHKNFTVFHFL